MKIVLFFYECHFEKLHRKRFSCVSMTAEFLQFEVRVSFGSAPDCNCLLTLQSMSAYDDLAVT